MTQDAQDNSQRLPAGGALIDRTAPVTFTVNGKKLKGYRGDTLASAMIANEWRFIGRSFKYHRPRGFVASGVEEPNGLFGVGEGGRFEPNQRGTMVELHEGLTAVTQNHFPSLEYDIGSLNAKLARFFPAGFYYKTFLRPRRAWKHLFEPFIRQAAGLGKAPKEPDPASYEHFYYACDVLIAGGGVAGIMAAKAAGLAGARVLLVEQNAWLGGRALVDEAEVDGMPIADWVAREIDALKAMPNVLIRTRCQASAHEDHNYALLYERVGDDDPLRAEAAGAPRHRLWRVRAGRVIAATGAIERPLAFAYNDVPGVMLASAVRITWRFTRPRSATAWWSTPTTTTPTAPRSRFGTPASRCRRFWTPAKGRTATCRNRRSRWAFGHCSAPASRKRSAKRASKASRPRRSAPRAASAPRKRSNATRWRCRAGGTPSSISGAIAAASWNGTTAR